MKRFFAFAIAVAFATNVLAADSTSPRPFYPPTFAVVKPQPMPLGDRLPIEIVLGQQEMGVDVSTTGAAVAGAVVGGLIGGLISAGIANAQVKAAEERVVPLRDTMIAYDFSRRVDAELRGKLASEGISMNPEITSMTTTWDAIDAQNANRLPSHAMVIYPRYSIDSKFARLRVQLLVQIVDRKVSPKGKVKSKPSFSRLYAFNYDIEDGNLDDNIGQWTSLGGEGMATLVDRGITQTVDMLVHDFSPQGRAEWKRRAAKQQSVKIRGERHSGFPVRETDDYVWVRSGSKTQFFEGFQPIDIAALKTTLSVAAVSTGPVGKSEVASSAENADAAKAAVPAASAGSAETVAPADSADTSRGVPSP